jgi:rhodanese-related sulfurtransferase
MFDFFKRDTSKSINVNAMDDLIGKAELIDIREPYEYKSGSIKTSKNIPMGNLLEDPDKYLLKEKTYYLICRSGARSSRTTKKLAKQGFTVINVAGGMSSYSGPNRQ